MALPLRLDEVDLKVCVSRFETSQARYTLVRRLSSAAPSEIRCEVIMPGSKDITSRESLAAAAQVQMEADFRPLSCHNTLAVKHSARIASD